MKSIEDPKFPKMNQNTANVIYAWDEKIVNFSRNSRSGNQGIYKNDYIIDIQVNTEVLTTGLVIPSETKRPLAVASTQWCK